LDRVSSTLEVAVPLLLAFLAYVALEIWVLVLVGQAIGFLGLLGLLILSAVVGAWALKREGRRSVTALGRAVQNRRPAEAEVADGMYVALAGVLLVIPGMLSTVAALVLLVPPVRRALARRAAARAVRAGSARMAPSVVVIGGGAPTGRPNPEQGAPMIIEGAPADTDRDR
jgi:UPF0716 protein FxsA